MKQAHSPILPNKTPEKLADIIPFTLHCFSWNQFITFQYCEIGRADNLIFMGNSQVRKVFANDLITMYNEKVHSTVQQSTASCTLSKPKRQVNTAVPMLGWTQASFYGN